MADIDIAERFRRIVEEGMGRGDGPVLEASLAENLAEHQRGNPQGFEGAKALARTLHRFLAHGGGRRRLLRNVQPTERVVPERQHKP